MNVLFDFNVHQVDHWHHKMQQPTTESWGSNLVIGINVMWTLQDQRKVSVSGSSNARPTPNQGEYKKEISFPRKIKTGREPRSCML